MVAVDAIKAVTAEGAKVYALGTQICRGKRANFRQTPTVRNAKATGIVLFEGSSGKRIAKFAIFRLPVITYSMPIPMTIKVAPTLPIIKY